MKVLHCSGLSTNLNYKIIYKCVRDFGLISRIKLKLTIDEQYFDCFIEFQEAHSAKMAFEAVKAKNVPTLQGYVKIFDSRNLKDENGDFIPKDLKVVENVERRMEIPMWHVITYKEGKSNLIRAWEELQNQVGGIPENNLKRYGRNLLVRAVDKSQAKMLLSYHPDVNGTISSVTPHKSFNTARGVVYTQQTFLFWPDSGNHMDNGKPVLVYWTDNGPLLKNFTDPMLEIWHRTNACIY